MKSFILTEVFMDPYATESSSMKESNPTRIVDTLQLGFQDCTNAR